MTSPDKKYCAGCREDYYNHNGNSTTGECWSFESAKCVKKFCIDWWTPMDRKENFYEVTTNSCHIETGKRLFLDKLPEHLRGK